MAGVHTCHERPELLLNSNQQISVISKSCILYWISTLWYETLECKVYVTNLKSAGKFGYEMLLNYGNEMFLKLWKVFQDFMCKQYVYI